MRVFFFQINEHAMSKMSSLLDTLALFAQTAAPATGAPAGPPPNFFQQLAGSGVLPIGLMLLAFWFLMIAPQRKKQKEHEKMLAALQSGDEVVTTGGIYGVITNVKDDRFVIRIADNTKIELGKGFVTTVLKKNDEEKK
jgi:preprotein translocase subunit YajC